jgi:hypothetical protein
VTALRLEFFAMDGAPVDARDWTPRDGIVWVPADGAQLRITPVDEDGGS